MPLGPDWRQFIEEAAAAAACPSDYPAATLLSSASTLIGNARWAQAGPGWEEPPHLWCGGVGDSGDGKSPGGDTILGQILPELERRMLGDFPDRLQEWKAAREMYEAKVETWKSEVRNAQKQGVAPPLPPNCDYKAEPQMPRLRQNDVTIERIATILATASPKGVVVVCDELAGWLLGMTAYNDAGRAFWIEAYGGRFYRVERQKNQDPIDVTHNVVSVLGWIQPERLAELMKSADDGLFARFIWFWPEPVPFRLGRQAPQIERATRWLDRLRQLDMVPGTGRDGAPAPLMVKLADEALPLMEDFACKMQALGRDASGLMKSAYGKARGLALRLSLTLELLAWCAREGFGEPPRQIGWQAFQGAIKLLKDYFLPMAERVYGDASTPEGDRNAATLAKWILRDRPEEVHVRHVQREVRLGGLKTAQDIHSAARVLIEAGWLRPPPPGGQGVGRARAAYSVNPSLPLVRA